MDLAHRPGQGDLSYVVNGGFARWPAIPVSWSSRDPRSGRPGNGEVLRWVPEGSPWGDSQAVGKRLGVMFLGTDRGDQPWDIATTPADISDGANQTLLLGENALAGASASSPLSHGHPTNWACPLPNFMMFVGSDDVCRTDRGPGECLGGQLAPRRGKDGPGWARANDPQTREFVNGGKGLTEKGTYPFIESGHIGGANFVFCDGSVRFLRETIDGTVYAKLITPAGAALPEAIRQAPLRLDSAWD
jgi:prepilin-type processing-associated H-X9-DG protein